MPANRLESYPILIRMRSDPAQVMGGIDPVISSIDPNMMASISTLGEMLRMSDPFLVSSLAAAVASVVGAFGLLIALIGIYGTVSYIVVLRTREVGIRIAIGAQKRDVLRLILGQGGRPVFAGLLGAILFAVGISYPARTLLYGLNGIDGVSIAGMSVLFLGIALLASYLPARRATVVDPMVALRCD
jgi:putative ABC transport system permease protein